MNTENNKTPEEALNNIEEFTNDDSSDEFEPWNE